MEIYSPLKPEHCDTSRHTRSYVAGVHLNLKFSLRYISNCLRFSGIFISAFVFLCQYVWLYYRPTEYRLLVNTGSEMGRCMHSVTDHLLT